MCALSFYDRKYYWSILLFNPPKPHSITNLFSSKSQAEGDPGEDAALEDYGFDVEQFAAKSTNGSSMPFSPHHPDLRGNNEQNTPKYRLDPEFCSEEEMFAATAGTIAASGAAAGLSGGVFSETNKGGSGSGSSRRPSATTTRTNMNSESKQQHDSSDKRHQLFGDKVHLDSTDRKSVV